MKSILVGESAASIDAYAATDPAGMFFAVLSGIFSAPELFMRFPTALWQRFCQFYAWDLLSAAGGTLPETTTARNPGGSSHFVDLINQLNWRA